MTVGRVRSRSLALSDLLRLSGVDSILPCSDDIDVVERQSYPVLMVLGIVEGYYFPFRP